MGVARNDALKRVRPKYFSNRSLDPTNFVSGAECCYKSSLTRDAHSKSQNLVRALRAKISGYATGVTGGGRTKILTVLEGGENSNMAMSTVIPEAP